MALDADTVADALAELITVRTSSTANAILVLEPTVERLTVEGGAAFLLLFPDAGMRFIVVVRGKRIPENAP